MYPELLHIGSLTLCSYGVFVALGLLACFVAGLVLFKKEGLALEEGLRSGLFILLGGLVGARMVYVAVNWERFSRGLEPLWKIVDGGMVFWGGVVGCILALFAYSGLRSGYCWRLGDLWAPPAALGITIGRIGCLLAGCSYGLPTDGPIAITFHHATAVAPLHTALHPTQIYYLITDLLVLIVVLWLRKRRKFEGQILLWYLILECNASLFVERFRGDYRGHVFGSEMSPGQFLATIILVGAAIALLVKSRKKTVS